MSKDHYIADLHLGHANIIKYCRRPFMSDKELDLLSMADRGLIRPGEVRISKESVELMDSTIIDNINHVVDENDRLWVLGDFCFGQRNTLFQIATDYRKRINCKRVNIIWGNHDNKKILHSVFNTPPYSCEDHDHVLTVVDGQNVFLDHYPMRSWDCAHHGAWMLYGQINNLPLEETRVALLEKFGEIFSAHGLEGGSTGSEQQAFFNTLLDAVADESRKGTWMLYGHVHDLFYDEDEGRLPKFHRKALVEKFDKLFGKHDLRGYGVLHNELLDAVAEEIYGTNLTLDVGVDREHRFAPWSHDDVRGHMFKKMPKWHARQDRLRDEAPPSTLKGDPSTAHPKF